MMELSRRLNAVANMISRDNKVADIGCDHGYVAIYLRENNISPRVIALDINKRPLAKAREHCDKYGYPEIETRLSNGLDALEIGEVDTVVCAGMGGKLVIDILAKSLDKVRKLRECIIQPQSDIEYVRRKLREMDIQIIDEDFIYDDGKFYPILKLIPLDVGSLKNVRFKDYEYKYGCHLQVEQNVDFKTYLLGKKSKFEEIIQLLIENNLDGRNDNRIKELGIELRDISEVLK